MSAPKTKWIHVNKHRILARLKQKTTDPVIRFQQGRYGKSHYGDIIAIFDKDGNEVARFVSKLEGDPLLPCGARVAVQTELEVRIIK